MQTMADELSDEGYDISVVIVNKTGAESSAANLANTCEFPVLQDVSSVDAWALHEGGKDDFIIYDAEGNVSAFLEYGGGMNTSLGSSAGYSNVKNAVIDAFGGE